MCRKEITDNCEKTMYISLVYLRLAKLLFVQQSVSLKQAWK